MIFIRGFVYGCFSARVSRLSCDGGSWYCSSSVGRVCEQNAEEIDDHRRLLDVHHADGNGAVCVLRLRRHVSVQQFLVRFHLLCRLVYLRRLVSSVQLLCACILTNRWFFPPPLLPRRPTHPPLVCLRIQSNPENKRFFNNISSERAFGDFMFASVALHLVVMNFLG